MKYKTPRGTRDFSPQEMEPRRFVMNVLSSTYSLFGFKEWDGPAFENIKTLTGKAGSDIAKEIYLFEDKGGRKLGLRFELTTSLVRLIANNPSTKMPLRLFNIGNVWRYERPSAGRYREFLQADADIFGSAKMTCEADLLVMASLALEKLKFSENIILLNNRKILEDILKKADITEDEKGILRSLDKLEKIGKENVWEELKQKGVSLNQFENIMKMIEIPGNNNEKLKKIKTFLQGPGYERGREGVEELEEILKLLKNTDFTIPLRIEFSLVRGLDYYTGPIYEIKSTSNKELGSFVGGGRYDTLVEKMGGKKTPAVGISFGIERIIDIIKKKDNYSDMFSSIDVFVCYQSPEDASTALNFAKLFRKEGITTDFSIDVRKLSKQLSYASSINAEYAFIIFPKGEMKLKNLRTEKDVLIDIPSAISLIKKERQKKGG